MGASAGLEAPVVESRAPPSLLSSEPVYARIGTSGYSYPQWKGSFYPADMKTENMLSYYAGRFDTVEINNTFYRMPKAAVLEKWAAGVGPDFRFSIKAPRRITHHNRLVNADANVGYLFEQIATLGDKLGPVLFQPPPFLAKDLPRLESFLAILPADHAVAFEFRHPSWFDRDVYDLLRARGACLCISDRETATDLDVPVVPTAAWGYVRLRREHYGEAELADWARRIKDLWTDVYVYFMHEDTGEAPVLADRFRALLA